MTPDPPSETASRGSTSPLITGNAMSTAGTRTMPPGTPSARSKVSGMSRSPRSSIKLRRRIIEDKERKIAVIERTIAKNEGSIKPLESAVKMNEALAASGDTPLATKSVASALEDSLRAIRAAQRNLKKRVNNQEQQLEALCKEQLEALCKDGVDLEEDNLIQQFNQINQRIVLLLNQHEEKQKSVSMATNIIAENEENEISIVSEKKGPATTKWILADGGEWKRILVPSSLPNLTGTSQAGVFKLPSAVTSKRAPGDINAEDDDHGGTMVPGQCSHLHLNSSQRGGTTILQQWPNVSPSPSLDGFNLSVQVNCVNAPANVDPIEDRLPVKNEEWQDAPVDGLLASNSDLEVDEPAGLDLDVDDPAGLDSDCPWGTTDFEEFHNFSIIWIPCRLCMVQIPTKKIPSSLLTNMLWGMLSVGGTHLQRTKTDFLSLLPNLSSMNQPSWIPIIMGGHPILRNSNLSPMTRITHSLLMTVLWGMTVVGGTHVFAVTTRIITVLGKISIMGGSATTTTTRMKTLIESMTTRPRQINVQRKASWALLTLVGMHTTTRPVAVMTTTNPT